MEKEPEYPSEALTFSPDDEAGESESELNERASMLLNQAAEMAQKTNKDRLDFDNAREVSDKAAKEAEKVMGEIGRESALLQAEEITLTEKDQEKRRGILLKYVELRDVMKRASESAESAFSAEDAAWRQMQEDYQKFDESIKEASRVMVSLQEKISRSL